MRILLGIINTKLLIATGAVCMTITTCLLYHLKCNLALVIIIFFGTCTIYNVAKLSSDVVYRNKSYIILFSMMGVVLPMFLLKAQTIIWLTHVGIVSLLYYLPANKFFSFTSQWRSVPFLKILLISYVWSVVTVVLPFLENKEVINYKNIGLPFMERFLLISAMVIPFDIKDIAQDNEVGLKTIPLQFGIGNSKIIAIFLLMAALFMNYASLGISPAFGVQSLVILLLITFIIVLNKKSTPYLYDLFIDGMMVGQAMLIVLARYIFG